MIAELESERLMLQSRLDAQKSSSERNRKGQFATPTALAVEMLRCARALLGEKEGVRFMDPAIGTGSFYSALLNVFPDAFIDSAVGYEVDPHYGKPSAGLWDSTGLDMRLEDFTQARAPDTSGRFNLLVCNPPYVRHHHIASGCKKQLQERTLAASGAEINGLAGLYCYFLCLSHAWMSRGGLAGWLVPGEFMDVNYGKAVKRYLLDKVTLLHIHRFDPNDVQFSDALVSSAVVWLRNDLPRAGHEVRFTYGGTLERPKLDRLVPNDVLWGDSKWTRYPMKKNHEASNGPVLGDVFRIKRGLVTGSNGYFILSDREIAQRELPMEAFKPILPSPRYLPVDEIQGDRRGNPMLERRLFLLDPPWNEEEIMELYPSLWTYLEEGRAQGINDRYTCRHRKLWYAQEIRPPTPFVCTYLGRSDRKNGRPFRFILNNSRATAANVYLMLYPRESVRLALQDNPAMKRQVWQMLNKISPETMLGEGRVYGGGLHKLEPRELGSVSAKAVVRLFD
ncbi:MAG: SAM-dependent DNA methyltransferase [Gammaproteobacteria bacterium]|nr:SAM-dependent DNA methyltransferase [Gammaproteobacteria bacterium]